MIRFECDYGEGCHPDILKKLVETNFLQTAGYGNDEYSNEARELIKKAIKCDDCLIQFLVGGTVSNLIGISSILRPHQGVICASTGHINIHESGAIEATGHKVLPIPSLDGTIYACDVEKMLEEHYASADAEHMVQPGMVYISYPTENGTLYSKKQLEDLSATCKKWNIPLYVDGARMGYGLVSPENQLELSDFPRLCDMFYIGGTKVGTLMGEAMVVVNPNLMKDFRYIIKQKGALFAKGRLMGIQFAEMFRPRENGEILYFQVSRNAINQAMRIKQACKDIGWDFLFDSPTNQQFPIIPVKQWEKLKDKYSFSMWEKVDNEKNAMRICTSWATKEEDVTALINDLKAL